MAQRGEHRVRVEQQALLTVDLYPRSGIPVRVELHAVRPSGATIRIAHTALDGLALRDEVVLRFGNPRFARPIDLAATAHSRVDDGLASTYEMWFVDAGVAATLLIPHLRTIFNERSAHRMAIEPSRPVAVVVEDPRRLVRVHGRLADVSVHGLGIRLSAADEAALASSWQVHATVRVPTPGTPPVVLECRIRQRRASGKEVLLGLELDAPMTSEARTHREELAAWVVELQRQQALAGARQPRVRPPAA
jgi:hypothetical protein